MTNDEIMSNDPMTRRGRSCDGQFGFRHSLVLRHSSFVILLLLAAAMAIGADKRPITEKDLWDFIWIGDPQVSPDGSRVAFVRVTVNEKKEGYNASIWSVATSGGRSRTN